jgi:hypothetical protein
MKDPLPPAAPIERIRHHLVSLRMPRALEALDHVVQHLERGQATAIEAIETLLAEELTIREGRRIKAALRMARLTPIKTLSGFDFLFQPSLERSQVMALAALDFIDHHEVVHFIGQSAPENRTWRLRWGLRRCGPGAASTSPHLPISSTVSPVLSARAACASGSAFSAARRC